jgi:hypothetical protein
MVFEGVELRTACQSRSVISFDPDTIRMPSGENATNVIEVDWQPESEVMTTRRL